VARPELLNNLASSFVLEARRNERGLGALDEQAGVEVVLDRTTSRVGDSLARFVERAETADRVLVIATPEYAEKYKNASGTVLAAEADVINQRLLGTEDRKATVLHPTSPP
jgi:hypothetical protein